MKDKKPIISKIFENLYLITLASDDAEDFPYFFNIRLACAPDLEGEKKLVNQLKYISDHIDSIKDRDFDSFNEDDFPEIDVKNNIVMADKSRLNKVFIASELYADDLNQIVFYEPYSDHLLRFRSDKFVININDKKIISKRAVLLLKHNLFIDDVFICSVSLTDNGSFTFENKKEECILETKVRGEYTDIFLKLEEETVKLGTIHMLSNFRYPYSGIVIGELDNETYSELFSSIVISISCLKQHKEDSKQFYRDLYYYRCINKLSRTILRCAKIK